MALDATGDSTHSGILFSFLMIFLFVYKSRLAPKLPKNVEILLTNKITRFIFIFLLCKIKFEIPAHISLIIAFIFIII